MTTRNVTVDMSTRELTIARVVSASSGSWRVVKLLKFTARTPDGGPDD